ncbi:MAG: DUF305 domain-containing protein [Alphaproteobacteria bacterium]|nr:DUF305 domain-containing protein [Alphaproteobacteria bacterium]
MMAAGTAIMFIVMYEMVDGWNDFRLNLNMFYMALSMAAPMAILELALMRHMYPDRRLNTLIYVASCLVLVGSFIAVRHQAAIGDRQFLVSMIPHHSGAILMCREAQISDPEIQNLCERIIRSQQDEIDQMNRILERL